MLILLVLNLFSPFAEAQERANNSDLRGERILFSINHLKINYSLLRSSAGSHSLVINKGSGKENQKINSDVATVLDDQVSAEFINLKYFMGKLDTCNKFNLVLMRGEELRICPDDKKRLLKVAKLVKLIESKK